VAVEAKRRRRSGGSQSVLDDCECMDNMAGTGEGAAAHKPVEARALLLLGTLTKRQTRSAVGLAVGRRKHHFRLRLLR
jgi:hypothetical protein